MGNDPLGQSILRHNDKLDKSGVSVNSDPTSAYCVVLDFKGQARMGIGDINQVCVHSTLDIFPTTVGAEIPNTLGIQMVGVCSVFQMCLVFQRFFVFLYFFPAC